jgi:hypothetical protein
MKQREERRDRTIRVGERRRKRHLAYSHPDGVVDCVCEFSAWKFAKWSGRGCDCRGRKRGDPKRSCGVCTDPFAYRPAVRERIAAKRACRRLRADPHEDGARVVIGRARA